MALQDVLLRKMLGEGLPPDGPMDADYDRFNPVEYSMMGRRMGDDGNAYTGMYKTDMPRLGSLRALEEFGIGDQESQWNSENPEEMIKWLTTRFNNRNTTMRRRYPSYLERNSEGGSY